MNLFSVFLEFLKAKKISAYPRSDVLALREKRLRETLLRAFDHSLFYRKLWQSAGLTRENLKTVPLSVLPIVTKRQLMEAFSEVATEQNITKQDVESFIAEDQSGARLYKNKYVAMNTSGSSGYIGIFLFTREYWARLLGAIVSRILPPNPLKFLLRKSRVVFTGEISGHHAGASLIRSLPPLLFKTLNLTASMPIEKAIETLNAFRPHILTGYASVLARVAEGKLSGQLTIRPETIISSGEPLSSIRREKIKSAFGIPAANLYAATECLAIGLDRKGNGILDIFDDLVYAETVGDQGNPVPAGKLGRIIITNFNNDIFPLVRYALDDEITILPPSDQKKIAPFTQASSVSGRDLDRIIFSIPKSDSRSESDRANDLFDRSSPGRKFELHPMEIVGFFFPGLRQYQIEQTGATSATLRIVADGNRKEIETKIWSIVGKLLKERGVPEGSLRLNIDFVPEIKPDVKTGKTPIIVPWRK